MVGCAEFGDDEFGDDEFEGAIILVPVIMIGAASPSRSTIHSARIAGASTVHCVPDSERLADMGGSRGGRRNGRAAVGDADDTAVAAAPLLAAPVDMVSMLEAVAANPLLRQSHVRSVPGS